MRVGKRELAREFPQLSLLDEIENQVRTRVAWELTGESLTWEFLNFHCLNKWKQKLHGHMQARVCVRAFTTVVPYMRAYILVSLNPTAQWNEIKSVSRELNDKREFTREFYYWPLSNRTNSGTVPEFLRFQFCSHENSYAVYSWGGIGPVWRVSFKHFLQIFQNSESIYAKSLLWPIPA